LEGVVNELHAQQEEHEVAHAEAENKPPESPPELPIPTTALDERLTTVLLVIASSHRPEYLSKTLEHVMSYHPK
jgi:predicted nuclease of restriction endonuclease-like RecB superfamily